MGWAVGFDINWNRFIGYGVPAWCDHPDCREKIDRGLAYVCGNAPYGGDKGCGLYFCYAHQRDFYQRCTRCYHHRRHPYAAKPEHPEWINHIGTDPSWAEWRAENSEQLQRWQAQLEQPV